MPNRILKESLTRSESINELSWFAEVLFYRLIVVADDFGRFDGRAAVIKGTCFPLRNIRTSQIEKGLKELASVSMIFTYTVKAKSFLQIANWSKFQSTRAMKSKWPSPEDDNESQFELQNTKAAQSDQILNSANTCKQLHADECRCSRETRNENRLLLLKHKARAREKNFLNAWPSTNNVQWRYTVRFMHLKKLMMHTLSSSLWSCHCQKTVK
jgi:hypothetical protein